MVALEPKALTSLREEFERLFPVIDEPPEFATKMTSQRSSPIINAANEAQVGLLKLQIWIEGLINELTLEQRLRLDAEARAAQAARPPTGFAP